MKSHVSLQIVNFLKKSQFESFILQSTYYARAKPELCSPRQLICEGEARAAFTREAAAKRLRSDRRAAAQRPRSG